MARGEAISPLIRRLAAYIASAPQRALPRAVTERAKLHLLDTLAAMQRRWHASREYMTEWDRQRESEDVWPVP